MYKGVVSPSVLKKRAERWRKVAEKRKKQLDRYEKLRGLIGKLNINPNHQEEGLVNQISRTLSTIKRCRPS